MLKNFDSPDVYALAAFYFFHAGSLFVGTVCAALALLGAFILNKQDLL